MRRPARVPPSRPQPRAAPPAPTWTSVAAGAGFLALYLALCPHVAGDGDSSEFTAVLATLGLAHPTGYVPYTLLGHAWVGLWRSVGVGAAWAANAWSALGAAAAMAFAHALGARLLARAGIAPRPAAWVAALPLLAFGLDASWLDEAMRAEIDGWHVAWVLGACLHAVATLEAMPARRAEGRWLARRTAAWSAIVALGLAHHSTGVLASAPLTLALLASAWPLDAAAALASLAGLPIVALAWGYVAWRSFHPAAVQWGTLVPGLTGTWHHVTGAGYRHYLGGFAPAPEQRQELLHAIAPWLVPGALAALAWPFVRSGTRPGTRRGLAAALALLTVFPFAYGVPDPVAYFLAPTALGLVMLTVVLAERPAVRTRAVLAGAVAAVGLLALAPLGLRTALERRDGFAKADEFLRRMWLAVPVRRGFVLWDEDLIERLVQYQQVDGLRRELVVVRPRLLMDDGTRALFTRRHGFDPLGGGSPPPEAVADDPETIRQFARAIAEGINRASPDSVIVFEPEQGRMQLLPKAGAR